MVVRDGEVHLYFIGFEEGNRGNWCVDLYLWVLETNTAVVGLCTQVSECEVVSSNRIRNFICTLLDGVEKETLEPNIL